MTYLAVGGEAECFSPAASNAYVFDNTGSGTRFEGNASRGGMKVTAGVSEIELFFNGGNVADAWAHMYLYQESVAAKADWIIFKTAAGANVAKIGLESDGRWSLYKYSGGSWGTALATSATAVIVDAYGAFDIHLNINASGEFTVMKDGAVVVTYSGNTVGDSSNYGRIHWVGQTGASNELVVSQVVVSTTSTVGTKVVTLYATGNSGVNTSWTGDYTAIDEAAYDNADYIETNTAGNVETFAAADINAAYSTYIPRAVVVATRGSNDSGSAITDVQAALRVSSTNYFSSNLSLAKDGLEHSVQAIFETNPNTSSPWTQSEINAAEFGLKAV